MPSPARPTAATPTTAWWPTMLGTSSARRCEVAPTTRARSTSSPPSRKRSPGQVVRVQDSLVGRLIYDPVEDDGLGEHDPAERARPESCSRCRVERVDLAVRRADVRDAVGQPRRTPYASARE